MPKIATIVGARPQFIKCAPVSREIHKYFSEILIHTGQHYDQNMSETFFKELSIPEPDYNLGIGSGNHGEQTGRMLTAIEQVLLDIRPDLVLIYGDTNSTLAGALATAKLHIPVAHVEAGLRSFNRKMPEEINRIVSDKLSKYLFVPTQTAVNNLSKEGQTDGVYNVGDVMFDSFLYNLSRIDTDAIMQKYNLTSKNYILTTVHRPQNTDDPQRLPALINTIQNLHELVIFPIHPRTRNLMKQFGIKPHSDNLFLVDPVSYREMIVLEKHARAIITDSGGVQKEAFFAGVPCIVLRGETEWVELVENGWAHLIGNHFELIPKKLRGLRSFDYTQDDVFGDGNASGKIVEILKL
ncbi:UDP-N-acetylglucosamine 2-epimerase (non-hydrolyzing) [bacterium]|nr:UDP-N-acetylglucosamine 2-epimerase (non-hydrolyzing) [bacterium]